MSLHRFVDALRSVRSRILTSILLVTALGMTVAGSTAYLLQRERVVSSIDDRLTQTVEGLQFIADGGEAGQDSPTTVIDFLMQAMQRVLPAHNESTVGIIDGRAALVPSSNLSFRLDRDEAFIDRVVAESHPERVVLGTVRSEFGTLRYAIIPITIEGDAASGLYVSAYNLDAELLPITQAFRTYAVVAAVMLLLVGLVGWVVAGRLLRPIRSLRETANSITDTDLSRRITVVGRDDVSDLARTVNGMLERLEAGFLSQRRLLDDVGHELKTPLTIMRGHLELLDPEHPEDIAATRAIAIDELDRLTTLVGDIALLAKSRVPGFVNADQVAVADLTSTVFAKARMLSAAHEWALTARADARAQLDSRRVTQAWLQLAENAAKYSPAGTAIEIGSATSADDEGRATVDLWVRDYGPGIDPEQLDRVFERFTRADEGRGVEGSGLGLSIVAAISEAHGGTAFAVSGGVGTRVVIRLPRDSRHPRGRKN
ncbi:HAMP domain-containing histidine kinase [Salinibacterium sp. dk2585]|uniref:sensor histidine kinase n=1 Tax=unclassified Salinibacterium TaxID=2632331 RepID=UPI0011C25134|nr:MULTISPECIES: HAMP domain-containing sensor histidine kinase [unclassified Salinibacterium]QEE60876.1 HAMP domain-containing histidine kinase [Salinibacterium sp. dk2585]TXK55947.1 HAMP domain-containing histidine kinase [Salinibacterium sp. dk5596]